MADHRGGRSRAERLCNFAEANFTSPSPPIITSAERGFGRLLRLTDEEASSAAISCTKSRKALTLAGGR